MKHTGLLMPLFTPDIIEYIAGREVVCRLVLAACKHKTIPGEDTSTVTSKLFTELRFSTGDIIEIILAVGRQLQIKFSYQLILQLDRYSSVEDLATKLWKYMCRVVRFN